MPPISVVSNAPEVVHIEAAPSFDLADEKGVFGYAAFVVVGVVESSLGRVDDSTQFSVRPLETLKGGLPSTIIVEQLGFEEGATRYEVEEQPLLSPGGTYLLALTNPYDSPTSEILTVVGGSVSGQPIDVNDKAEVDRLRAAARNGVWPGDLRPDAAEDHRARQAQWAQSHAARGYDVRSSGDG